MHRGSRGNRDKGGNRGNRGNSRDRVVNSRDRVDNSRDRVDNSRDRVDNSRDKGDSSRDKVDSSVYALTAFPQLVGKLVAEAVCYPGNEKNRHEMFEIALGGIYISGCPGTVRSRTPVL